MIMADILAWFLVVCGTYLVLICHWLAGFALFPRAVEAARDRYGQRPVVATLLGLLVTLVAIVLLVIAQKVGHPLIKVSAVVVASLPLLIAFVGSAGLALRIGSGLAAPIDATQPWRRVLRGGMVLAALFLLPFVGWFLVLPWALVSGLGAALLGRRATVQLAQPETAGPPAGDGDTVATRVPHAS